jgi:DHA2 family multidrug resistance protein-like MFS transporter
MSAGLASLATFPQGGSAADFLWRMALCGLGFGFFQTPNNRTLISAAPRARSGAAGGMLGTARLLGQTLGAAVVAILFRAFPGTGSNVILWFAAAMALMAAAISMWRLAGGSPQA